MNKVLLIDGHSILNRAFYGLPDLTNAKGQHTNAVLGFVNIFLKLIEEESPTHVFVAFDVHQPTFRHLMYSEYKGTRKGMPKELVSQVPLLKEVLHAMGVATVEKGGYEADDIIGTFARVVDERDDLSGLIVSSDKDLLQLISDKVQVKLLKQTGYIMMDKETFRETYKVDP
ncbi:MAG: DNA polymerase I, partial [Lachnospiraceae bacterium]|nr:DNA polymerase I [Lachnospiraceae bacterium]